MQSKTSSQPNSFHSSEPVDKESPALQNPFVLLSTTQMSVLEILAKGHSAKEIGRKLGTSPETIRKHLANIRDRLGIRRSTELAALWHFHKKKKKPTK